MRLTQAILPVAGLGTRFLPWTKTVPKELLPIGRMPIIALIVDECLSVGIRDICFVISRGKERLLDFFRNDEALERELKNRGKSDLLAELSRYDEVRFHSVYQDEQLGDGHAILQAKDWVDSDHVAVLFGDDLVVGAAGNGLQQLVRAANEIRSPKSQVPSPESDIRHVNFAMLCLQDVPREDVSRYGVAAVMESDGRLKRITGLVEKPRPAEAPSTLAIVGKYIIPRSLFSTLEEIGRSPEADAAHRFRASEIRLIDALIHELGRCPTYGYVFEGRRFDVGTPEGYKEAVAVLG